MAFKTGDFSQQVVFVGGLTDGLLATEYVNVSETIFFFYHFDWARYRLSLILPKSMVQLSSKSLTILFYCLLLALYCNWFYNLKQVKTELCLISGKIEALFHSQGRMEKNFTKLVLNCRIADTGTPEFMYQCYQSIESSSACFKFFSSLGTLNLCLLLWRIITGLWCNHYSLHLILVMAHQA